MQHKGIVGILDGFFPWGVLPTSWAEAALTACVVSLQGPFRQLPRVVPSVLGTLPQRVCSDQRE